MESKFLFFLFLLPLALSPLYGLDPYILIEQLLPRDQLPRLLNSEDIADLLKNDPQPLLFPIGDFNHDGSDDVAISGIYDLPKEKKRYFLLVGSLPKSSVKPMPLFFEEYLEPVFLHKSGTTGEGDPGDQAFSRSFCAHCEQGADFYWNKRKKRFDLKPWVATHKRMIRKETVPAVQVPQDVADQAFQVVGRLKDVSRYINSLKKGKRALGVRVEPDPEQKENRVWVKIFEKKKNKENEYDLICVDLEKKIVVKRRRKVFRP